ncbi:12917_t:CDS:2, partial [Gigaspora margarita]
MVFESRRIDVKINYNTVTKTRSEKDLKNDAKIRELWMKSICDHDKHAKFKIKETYDFIIVGAGTAGCVLARELIYGIPNINILVLEAGGPNAHSNGLISMPCTWFQAYQLYDHDWGYVTQEQKMKSHINPTREMVVKKGVPYPRGKVWGGCSSVNGMFTNENGKRCSLADGFLSDALKKVEFHPGSEPNGFGKVVAVDVRSYAHVLDIIWDEENKKENIAIGVRYFCNGTVREAFIAPKGEVILCGGGINSPQILMLSGVGPKENLEANNIKVRKELPVGRNLLDHPSCLFAAKSTIDKIHHWSGGSEVGIIHKANIEGKIPCKEELFDENTDIQICAMPLRPSLIEGLSNIDDNFGGIILLPILNVPSSVGYLELYSNNPFDQPRIHLNFFEKSDDLYRMISSLKLVREILKQPPLSTVYNVKEIEINDEFGQWSTNGDDISDEDWEKFVLERGTTTFHPSGTTKMAPESKDGVVNHRLQVYGTKNLRVVDTSIFPYIPTGNTNAPIAMVAWRA